MGRAHNCLVARNVGFMLVRGLCVLNADDGNQSGLRLHELFSAIRRSSYLMRSVSTLWILVEIVITFIIIFRQLLHSTQIRRRSFRLLLIKLLQAERRSPLPIACQQFKTLIACKFSIHVPVVTQTELVTSQILYQRWHSKRVRYARRTDRTKRRLLRICSAPSSEQEVMTRHRRRP